MSAEINLLVKSKIWHKTCLRMLILMEYDHFASEVLKTCILVQLFYHSFWHGSGGLYFWFSSGRNCPASL